VAAPNPSNDGDAQWWVLDTRSPEVEREEECTSGWSNDAEGGSTGGALWLLASRQRGKWGSWRPAQREDKRNREGV
jgi:hypothetical protein